MRRHGRPRRSAGFTLVELVVVVLIVGILSALMLPQYNKTVENSKADDASSVVTMIGQASRMCYLDNNAYADGTLDDSCNGQPCTVCQTGNCDRCQLVACHYLGSRKWTSKIADPVNGIPYTYKVGFTSCGANIVACASRAGGQAPYSNWGYTFDTTGRINAVGGAPTPSQ